MECKCCTCPLKAGGIKNLKEQAKEDFNNMLKVFFDEHPYVENIYLADKGSYFAQSIFIYKNRDRYIIVNLE